MLWTNVHTWGKKPRISISNRVKEAIVQDTFGKRNDATRVLRIKFSVAILNALRSNKLNSWQKVHIHVLLIQTYLDNASVNGLNQL
jgi:hypothetical protein